MEKSSFYSQQNKLSDLSSSSQFKLRQLMARRLQHRLELSKDQVQNFISFLSEIKEYYVILNETILQILTEVRDMLISGKVMKSKDLENIVKTKDPKELQGYPN